MIDATYDSGYESLSGFTESFKKQFGSSPVKSKDIRLIHITRILTPLGPMIAGAVDEGICLLKFADHRKIEMHIRRIKKYFKAETIPGKSKYFGELSRQIDQYFKGQGRKFDIPIALPGTDFQQKVWQILQTIPYGSTWSYQEQAEKVGNPKAVRAVARSNGDNRITIIIPCHRVIGKDGKLTGYGGGLWRKKVLQAELDFLENFSGKIKQRMQKR